MRPSRVAIIGTTWPVYEEFCPNWNGMTDGLERLGIDFKMFSCRPSFNPQEVIDYKPDLVIYGLLDMVKDKKSRLRIREALPDAKIVVWYGDLRDGNTGQIRADISEVDMMFVSNDAQEAYYKRLWKAKEVRFLPLGSKIYETEFQRRYGFAFVFIGGIVMHPAFVERAETILSLKSNHRLKIVDASVNRPELRGKVMREMPTIYRSSTITLDWSHFTDIKGYTSNRYWIIPASGGFPLTKRFPACEDFYPEGTRVYFDTIEELIEKRDFYTDHPEEREKIRLAGLEHAKNHTYDKRFISMFRTLYE